LFFLEITGRYRDDILHLLRQTKITS
jgi:hypothetical protein